MSRKVSFNNNLSVSPSVRMFPRASFQINAEYLLEQEEKIKKEKLEREELIKVRKRDRERERE